MKVMGCSLYLLGNLKIVDHHQWSWYLLVFKIGVTFAIGDQKKVFETIVLVTDLIYSAIKKLQKGQLMFRFRIGVTMSHAHKTRF